VNFEEDKGGKGIRYGLKLETELPKNIKYEVLRPRPILTTIRGVFLHDELVSEIQEKHIDVKFLSNGTVMSKGVMRLATSDNEQIVPKGTLESFICLAGYPRPIVSSNTKEEAEKLCREFEEGLDERLTQDTMSRLPPKLKQIDSQTPNEKTEEQKKAEANDKKASSKPEESKK
jgi:hypothetical protein